MHLVEVLLPLNDNDGQPLDRGLYKRVAGELTERFGGLTAHTRAPAQGLWKEEPRNTTHDDIVIYEVMTPILERDWWETYRLELERRFRQQHVVIRAIGIVLL